MKAFAGLLRLFLSFWSHLLSGCDLIKMKVNNAEGDADRPAAARANGSYLYRDELVGIVAPGTPVWIVQDWWKPISIAG